MKCSIFLWSVSNVVVGAPVQTRNCVYFSVFYVTRVFRRPLMGESWCVRTWGSAGNEWAGARASARSGRSRRDMWCGPPLTLLLSVCLFTWRAEEPSGGDAVAALAPPALCTTVSGGHLPPDTCSVQRRHGEHDPGAEQRAPRRYVRVRAVCGSSTLFWLKCWCYNVSALLPAPPNPFKMSRV